MTNEKTDKPRQGLIQTSLYLWLLISHCSDP